MIGYGLSFTMCSKPDLNAIGMPLRVIAPSAKMQTMNPSSIARRASRSEATIFFGESLIEIGITPMRRNSGVSIGVL
ncbi:MAG: hypothetical protein BWY59_01707 [Verrucomicrobia bacterium ADurb.Bin345]|nr:MAG: hypothetical protein BWY59_01707 [Verrucomicrobia bacterium ADurb.Bin345]